MARRAKAPVSPPPTGGVPEVVHRVIAALGLIPGVGERTATRYALWLASGDMGPGGPAATIEGELALLRSRVRKCPRCRALCDAEGEACAICADGKRDAAQLCVVAGVSDMLAIEASQAYRGRYFVLGALLDPLAGVSADEIPAGEVAESVTPGMEVILAMPGTTEGDATTLLLARALQGTGVKVTSLARGVPHGGTLEHADQVTVGRAFAGRQEVK